MLVSNKYEMYDDDFKYLTKMSMDSVTEENVAIIISDRDICAKELDELMRTSLTQMWLNELDVLEQELLKQSKK